MWNKNDILYIKWVDIVSRNGWSDEKEVAEETLLVCESIGFFLNESEKVIRISDSINGDGERTVLVIPKGVIIDIKKLSKEK